MALFLAPKMTSSNIFLKNLDKKCNNCQAGELAFLGIIKTVGQRLHYQARCTDCGCIKNLSFKTEETNGIYLILLENKFVNKNYWIVGSEGNFFILTSIKAHMPDLSRLPEELKIKIQDKIEELFSF